jgi:hypothetical protein
LRLVSLLVQLPLLAAASLPLLAAASLPLVIDLFERSQGWL